MTAYTPPAAIVERAARAAYQKYEEMPGREMLWADLCERRREGWRGVARAALLAAHPVITTAEEAAQVAVRSSGVAPDGEPWIKVNGRSWCDAWGDWWPVPTLPLVIMHNPEDVAS